MSVRLLGIAYIAGGNTGGEGSAAFFGGGAPWSLVAIHRKSLAAPPPRKYSADKENTPSITIPPATQAVFGKEPRG